MNSSPPPGSSSPLPEISSIFASVNVRTAILSPSRKVLAPSSPHGPKRVYDFFLAEVDKLETGVKSSKVNGKASEKGGKREHSDGESSRPTKAVKSSKPVGPKAVKASKPVGPFKEGPPFNVNPDPVLPVEPPSQANAICAPLPHDLAPPNAAHPLYQFLHKQPLFEPFTIGNDTFFRNIRTPMRGFCGWASGSQFIHGNNIGAIDLRARTAQFLNERSDVTLALLAAHSAQAIHGVAFDDALAEMPAIRASVTARPDVEYDGGRLADLTTHTAIYLAHAIPARVITYMLLGNGTVSQELDITPESEQPLPIIRLLLHAQHWEPLLSTLPANAATSWDQVTDIDTEENSWLKKEKKEGIKASKKASASSESHGETEEFILPDLPRAAAFLDAVIAGLSKSDLPRSTFAAARDYIESMKQGPSAFTPPTAAEIATEDQEQDALLLQLRAVLRKHGLSEDLVSRYRRPSGSVYYAVGCLLFYPPWSNREGKDGKTLVSGPDTTNRLIDMGCTDAQFTKDFVEWVFHIPFGNDHKYGNTPHLSAENLRDIPRPAAQEIWNVLTTRAKQQYRFRARREGFEIVYGTPARNAYRVATENIGGGWRRLTFSTELEMPGASADGVTFPSGEVSIPSHLFYRPIPGARPDFGKLTVEASHPSSGSLRVGMGGVCSAGDFHNHGALHDTLTDVLVFGSTGQPASRPVRSTFSFVVRPRASIGQITLKDVTSLRGRERDRGSDYTRAELEQELPGVTAYIETRIPPAQAGDKRSLLFRFCAANTSKANATMGKSGMSARAKKAADTRGPDGHRAAGLKARKTMGPDRCKEAVEKAKITHTTEKRKVASVKAKATLGDAGRRDLTVRGHVTRRARLRLIKGHDKAEARFAAAVDRRVAAAVEKGASSTRNLHTRNEVVSRLLKIGIKVASGKGTSFVSIIPKLQGWHKDIPKKPLGKMVIAQVELLGTLLTARVIKNGDREDSEDEETSGSSENEADATEESESESDSDQEEA